MIILRMLGWFMLFFGVILLSHDVFQGMTLATGFVPVTLADAWNAISPGAADDLVGTLRLNYGSIVATPVAFFVNGWAFALLLVPGLIIEAICRPKPIRRIGARGKLTRDATIEARKAEVRHRRKSAAR